MGIPLTSAKEGATVTVKEILSGWRLRKRLSDMGLYEGTRVEVKKNDVWGPIILKILDSQIILGRNEARKIMVEISE